MLPYSLSLPPTAWVSGTKHSAQRKRRKMRSKRAAGAFISCAVGSGEKIIEEEAKNACARHSGIRLSIIDKVDNSLPCTTCNTLRYDLSWGLLYRRLLHSPVSWAHGAQPRLRLPWPCWPWLSRCISRPAFSRYSRGPLAWPSETWERSCALVS